jgi:hypothetical protein
MSTNAIPAQGTELKLGAGSPLSYTKIAEVNSISGPGGSVSVIDVTDLSSAAKEKMAGLNDNGQISFECNFIPSNTQHAALVAAKAAGTILKFQLVFPDTGSTTWSFDGFVVSLPPSFGVDGVLKASITIEVTGEIVES